MYNVVEKREAEEEADNARPSKRQRIIERPIKIQQPNEVQRPIKIQQPNEVQRPIKIQQPNEIQRPDKIQQPNEVQLPIKIQQPNEVQRPVAGKEEDEVSIYLNWLRSELQKFSSSEQVEIKFQIQSLIYNARKKTGH